MMFSRNKKKEADTPLKKLLKLAAEAQKNKEYQDALIFYDKALHLDRNDMDIWLSKGRLCMEMEQHTNAVNCFDQVLNIDPECFEGVFLKAKALEKKDSKDEALKQYQRAIRINATDHRPYLFQGYLLRNLAKYKEAIESLDQALRYKPDHSGALYQKGMCHEELGQYRKAQSLYNGSLKNDPGNFDTLMSLGRLKARLSDHKEAVENFKRARNIKEKRLAPTYNIAVSLALLDRTGEALKELEEGLSVRESEDQNNELMGRYFFQMALCCDRLGQKLQALQYITEARGYDGNNSNYSNYLSILGGEYHSDLGHPFTLSLLEMLKSNRPRKVHSGLMGLVKRGDTRTIPSIIRTAYDGEVLARTLMLVAKEGMDAEEYTTLEKKMEGVMKNISALDLNPWTLEDKCRMELDAVRETYPVKGGISELSQRLSAVLDDIKYAMEKDKGKLHEKMEEFMNILHLNPKAKLFPLLIYLVAYTGLSLALVLETNPDVNLIDISRDPEHLKHTAFSRFSVSTSTFSDLIKEGFQEQRSRIIDQAVEKIRKDMVPSVSGEKKDDTWLTFGGDP